MGSLRIVLSDLQIPFQNNRAVRLALDTILRLKPDGIDLLGDIWDCYSVSKFDKNPERKLSLKRELRAVNKFLDAVGEAAPKNCDIRFSEGNHEDRLRKYVWCKAPALAGLDVLSTRSLLGLDRRGWGFYDYSTPYKIGGLWYHHGSIIRKHAGSTALASMIQCGGSIIVGHSHRLGHTYLTTWGGTSQAWENGCLCSLSPEYTMRPNWQRGFSLVSYGRGGRFGVQQVHIHHGKCWVGGDELK